MKSMRAYEFGKVFELFCMEHIRKTSGLSLLIHFKTEFAQHLFGDFSYFNRGYYRTVDTKVEWERDRPTGNFPIEIWQCVDKKEKGWFQYALQCDEIWYSTCPKSEAPVFSDYLRVSLGRLRKHGLGEFKTGYAPPGPDSYGNTELRLAPINRLVSLGIAERHAFP